MKRSDITSDTLKMLNKKLNKYNEDSDVSFVIDEISVIGDLLDFEKESEKLNIHLKCSDFYSFFDERSVNELIEDAKKEVKSFKEVDFMVDSVGCKFKHQEIGELIQENLHRYKKELLDSDIPNIFNNEVLRGKFERLAQNQRGYPEYEMKEAQKIMGGGIYPDLMEHIGDLTHRMAQRIYISSGDVHLGLGDMYSKLEKGVNSLREGDGFKSEQQRNRLSNFNYNKEYSESFGYDTYEDYNEICDSHSLKYTKEHSKLTIYNEMQHAAKYAAVHLGNGDFKKSLEEIKKLKSAADDGTYSKKASVCLSDYEYQSLELVLNKIKSKYKNELKKLNISEKDGIVDVSDIVIKPQFRDEGIGTDIMQDIAKYAKNNKLVVKLEPNEKNLTYGTKSKASLIKFYKKIGFNENKGVNKDSDFNGGEMILDYRQSNKSRLRLK